MKLATVRYSFCVSMTRVQGWCSLSMLLLFLKKKDDGDMAQPEERSLKPTGPCPPSSPYSCCSTSLWRFLRDPMSLLMFTRSKERSRSGGDDRSPVCSLPVLFAVGHLAWQHSPSSSLSPLLFFLVAREGGVDWQEGCVKVSPQWLCMSGVDRM